MSNCSAWIILTLMFCSGIIVMSSNKGQNARALVEPLALDSRTLGDSDLSALSLSHSSEQYTSNDFEEFANIQAEFECMNSEGVMTDDDRIIIERNIETDTIVPDVEMTEISEQVQAEHVYTMANQNSQNIVFQTKPTLQRVPVSAVQVMFRSFNAMLKHYVPFTITSSSDEANCLPDYTEPVDYDSVACKWTRHQPNSEDISPTDSFGRTIAVFSTDFNYWQICGWQCRSVKDHTTCQVYCDY